MDQLSLDLQGKISWLHLSLSLDPGHLRIPSLLLQYELPYFISEAHPSRFRLAHHPLSDYFHYSF